MKLKYCSKCKKIYPDGIDCECISKKYSWEKVEMLEVDIESVCKCGSTETEGMLYIPPYKYISCNSIDPAYCRCAKCEQELQNRIDHEDSMKYYIIDNYRDEDTFCDDNDEVDEYFENNYLNCCDHDSGPLDVIVLKLEPYSDKVRPEDFKSPRNTHLVIYDNETYKVEEAITPELEYDGGYTVNW